MKFNQPPDFVYAVYKANRERRNFNNANLMVYCASPDPFMVLLIRVKSKPMSNSNSLEMDHLEDSPNKFNKGIRNFYPSQSPTFQEALISCSFPSFHLVETSQHWQKHPYKRMLKYKCNKITKATGIKHLQSSCST